MREDCTDALAHYREIARAVWNLGFWPNAGLREVVCVSAYEQAMGRLFEGMVLLPLGFDGRVKTYPEGLGEPVAIEVKVEESAPDILVARELEAPEREWMPHANVSMSSFEGRFVGFFDWSQLERRDYRYVLTTIRRWEARQDLVGRVALVEFNCCRFSVEREEVKST